MFHILIVKRVFPAIQLIKILCHRRRSNQSLFAGKFNRALFAAFIAPNGIRFSAARLNTNVVPTVFLPSRLQRPAACKIESRPDSCRNTTGKSISTPASTSWVAITLTIGCDLSFSNALTFRMVSLIWAGHIILDRWSFIPSFGKRSYSSLASFRVFTIHNTLLYIATLAAISSYVFPVLSITNFTRRSLSCRANSFGMISVIWSIP